MLSATLRPTAAICWQSSIRGFAARQSVAHTPAVLIGRPTLNPLVGTLRPVGRLHFTPGEQA